LFCWATTIPFCQKPFSQSASINWLNGRWKRLPVKSCWIFSKDNCLEYDTCILSHSPTVGSARRRDPGVADSARWFRAGVLSAPRVPSDCLPFNVWGWAFTLCPLLCLAGFKHHRGVSSFTTFLQCVSFWDLRYFSLPTTCLSPATWTFQLSLRFKRVAQSNLEGFALISYLRFKQTSLILVHPSFFFERIYLYCNKMPSISRLVVY